MTKKNSPDVAIILPHLGMGGTQAVAIRIANALSSRDLKVDLIIVADRNKEMGDISKEIRQIRFHGKHVFLSMLSLMRYFRQNRPRGILSIQGSENIACGLARFLIHRDATLLVSEHNNLTLRLDVPKWRAYLAILGRRIFYPFADTIVCVSNSIAKDLTKNQIAERTRKAVIYNPLDLAVVREKALAGCTHKFIGHDGCLLVSFGRLEAQKDFATLIRAFSLLPEALDAKLIILGDGSQKEYLQSIINELSLSEKIDLAGHSSNPFAYLAHADAFVMSSVYEGNPLSMVEALACRVPVVSTSFEGVEEILDDNTCGIVSPVGDPKQLSQAIQEALSRRFDRDLFDLKVQRYDAPLVINQYVAALESTKLT